MPARASRNPIPDAVIVTGSVVWAPPLDPGSPCRTIRFGWPVSGSIVEVIDRSLGKVLVLADPDQEPTATQDGETWQLFTPGEPFECSWAQGLDAVQRADGRWEQPILETVRERMKAVPGWQLSDAVRCDPAYRNRATGGGVRSEGGRFVGRGPNGASVERQRWTTTLTPEALEVLRTLAEREGINRNEVVERLLLAPCSLGFGADDGPAEVTMTFKVSKALEQRVAAAAAVQGVKCSTWIRGAVARFFPDEYVVD